VSLSITQPAEQSADVQQTETLGTQSTGVLFMTWFTKTLADFLKTAWWVLPIPIIFSLWRQFRPYEVCGHCGERELVPVVVQHGEEPPLF
jgi:hypothetical protein